MKQSNFINSNIKIRPNLDLAGFEIIGIKKPITVSDSDMVGQPVFYERKLVGTIMHQCDGHTLIDVNSESTFIIDEYKSGQIRGKDIKIHLRG